MIVEVEILVIAGITIFAVCTGLYAFFNKSKKLEKVLGCEHFNIQIQINGHAVDTISVGKKTDKEVVAFAEQKIKYQLEGKTVVKRLYLPEKFVNFVVK